jgi:hypothetical protein
MRKSVSAARNLIVAIGLTVAVASSAGSARANIDGLGLVDDETGDICAVCAGGRLRCLGL